MLWHSLTTISKGKEIRITEAKYVYYSSYSFQGQKYVVQSNTWHFLSARDNFAKVEHILTISFATFFYTHPNFGTRDIKIEPVGNFQIEMSCVNFLENVTGYEQFSQVTCSKIATGYKKMPRDTFLQFFFLEK